MSTFDPFSDSPFKIKYEGQEIVVYQNRLSPTTIRVSWTLPNSVSCGIPAAYNGVVITLDQTPTSLEKLPVDSTLYKADPTADANLHAGDKIGTAMVVATLYDDITTTYIDIQDAPTSGTFYVSVHAVDNVRRYHTDGVHSYSLPFGKKTDMPEAGYQIFKMGATGILSTTPTNLVPTSTYQFSIKVDSITPDVNISILGNNAQTYGELIDAMNLSLVMRNNPIVANTIPNIGTYWVDPSTKIVNKFDGEQYQIQQNVVVSTIDPMAPLVGTSWFNPANHELSMWDNVSWVQKPIHILGRDPRNPFCNDYWYDSNIVYKWNGGAWIVQPLICAAMDPTLPAMLSCGNYWFNNSHLFQWNEGSCTWTEISYVTVAGSSPVNGSIWFDASSNTVQLWDSVESQWINMPTSVGPTDPSKPTIVAQGTIWYDTIGDIFHKLDGTSWFPIMPIRNVTKPQSITDGALWWNTQDTFFYKLQMGLWTRFSPIVQSIMPTALTLGYFWYNPSTATLQRWDSVAWNITLFTNTPQLPLVGALWYNPTNRILSRWSSKQWEPILPVAIVSLESTGDIRFTSGTIGSTSSISVTSLGTLWAYQVLSPVAMPQQPIKGTDPVSSVPSYMQLGVGTDGSQDERRQMIDRIKRLLGYPSIDVELTKAQMDDALDIAFEKLRSASSASYKRGYFALDLQPRLQHYKLTDATVGFNKVVDVLYVYRAQATFLGSAQGNSVYGQMAVQQLFNMGKFDLLSYHMVSSYIKTMQQLFAAEIQFGWDEYTRTLSIMKDFPIGEKVLVDAMIERTEQELLVDRWTRNWLQKYATAQCRYMLADIRGKFTALPGAGGGTSLNASDLRQRADQEILECMDEIDNFVVNNKTDFGMATDFVLG